jgi:hypothetical protein
VFGRGLSGPQSGRSWLVDLSSHRFNGNDLRANIGSSNYTCKFFTRKMADITPIAAQNVTKENLAQFKEEADYLLDNGWRQWQLAAMMEIDEPACSKYLYGDLPVTFNIINKLRMGFKPVLDKRPKVAKENSGAPKSDAGESETGYQPIAPNSDKDPRDPATKKFEALVDRQEVIVNRMEALFGSSQSPSAKPPDDTNKPQ